MRGNLVSHRRDWAGGGSIPACAGEPQFGCPFRRESAVYPRLCGGTLWDYDNEAEQAGLSPPVRGNLM